MKKNVKILGAAAAALLAVAPVVASATVANASTVTVNSGATTTVDNASPLNFNVNLNATAGQTDIADIVKSVKLSVDGNAAVNKFSTDNVQIVTANGANPVTSGTLQPGVQYRVLVKDINLSNLLTGKTWNLGAAEFQVGGTGSYSSTAKSAELMSGGNFLSAPFHLTKAGDPTQPYFVDDTGNQVADNGTAWIGTSGDGVAWSQLNGSATASAIRLAAEKAVKLFPQGDNPAYFTTTDDNIKAQLSQQNVAFQNGAYVQPENGFYVTLTALSPMSNKTVSIKVPFQGAGVSYKGYPTINFSWDGDTNYSSDFHGSTRLVSKGKQNIPASKLVRTIKPGSTFNDSDAQKGFSATTADGNGSVDMSVLSNPVNTNVPGKYTVTLAATDWTTGKTSRLSYIVQVGDADTTYQTVNYPKEYGVNIWSIAGNTVSFTGNRQAGQSSVATFDTKTVNGVEYTRIESATSNKWIQSQYLGNHSNNKPAKPSNNGETKLNGVGRVRYNGKGAVRLLNANGHYVDQYVKNGASFKVWAEKTVNGQHLYRIGSQSQWIPAKYFSLN